MTKPHNMSLDPRMQAAVTELETLIRGHYPGATFEVAVSADDPDAINLYATVDATDSDDVLDVVLPRLFELQDTGLPLHVIPLRTPEREEQVHRQLQAERHLSAEHPMHVVKHGGSASMPRAGNASSARWITAPGTEILVL